MAPGAPEPRGPVEPGSYHSRAVPVGLGPADATRVPPLRAVVREPGVAADVSPLPLQGGVHLTRREAARAWAEIVEAAALAGRARTMTACAWGRCPPAARASFALPRR